MSEKTSRRDLPSSILRDVHRELIRDTPSDLIHKELWTSSTSSSDFLNTQNVYARSLAVMSMLGYIIGWVYNEIHNNFIRKSIIIILHKVLHEISFFNSSHEPHDYIVQISVKQNVVLAERILEN